VRNELELVLVEDMAEVLQVGLTQEAPVVPEITPPPAFDAMQAF
jgi:hypothetical protein